MQKEVEKEIPDQYFGELHFEAILHVGKELVPKTNHVRNGVGVVRVEYIDRHHEYQLHVQVAREFLFSSNVALEPVLESLETMGDLHMVFQVG